jgi:parallel beta-helix repeat protein
MITRKIKFVLAVLFFIVISVTAFEYGAYFGTNRAVHRYNIGEKRHLQKHNTGDTRPIAVQQGTIQHVVTKLEPINPSGTVLNAGGDKSIQSVIDSAKPGDKVLIKSGIYTESLTLKDGIILQGEDGNSVTIQCDMRIGPVLKIDNCKNVEISKLTLKHFNPISEEVKSEGNWPIVLINNSGVAIDNLMICDSFTSGIRITNDNNHLDHVIIADCTIYNNKTAGILVLGNSNVELNRNICVNNKINGILFKGVSDGVVTGNICKSNSNCGINIQDNASVDVIGNTCCQNQNVGIWFNSNSPLTVKDNNCFDNGISGIGIESQVKVTVVGNKCSRNAVNGIYFLKGVTGSVANNICTENKWHGISIVRDSYPTVENNKCFNNKRCGIYDEGVMLGRNKIYDNNEFCQQEIQMYLRTEDFNEMEKMVSGMLNEKKRFGNGNWQLNYFYGAFETGYGSRPFEDNISYIEKWISKYPSSVTARIAMAISLTQQGWSLRGGGYSNTVSPSSWTPFEKHLNKALEVLKEAEKLGVKDPGLYTEWINVAMGLHKLDDLETSFQKGVAIEPTYYPLYYNRCFAYLPKWYGKQGQYEQLAREAADSTKDKIGDSLYFLLARAMVRQVEDINELKKTGFDFNRVKQGVKDFSKHFPGCLDPDNCNRLCFMACAADDKESARDYFLDIGEQWDKRVWGNQETFEKYKAWARNRNEN